MRKTCLALMTFAVAACGGGGSSTPEPTRLVVLHTNDEHSHLFGFAPEIDDYPPPDAAGTGAIVGGIARRAKVLTQERAAATTAGADTITLSAGDETQGALPQLLFQESAPDFTLMKQLGYDAMCPGNHEFDLGPGAYAAAITAAGQNGGLPQIVATNIRYDANDPGDDALEALTGDGKPIVRSLVITTTSGLKIGLLGVVGVQASYYAPLKTPVLFSADLDEEADPAAGLPKLYADLEPAVATLRDTAKVDVVILMSHSGVDTIDPTRGEDYQIAAHVSGIDLIVSGHSHTPLQAPQIVAAPDGYMVPIVQAGSFGEWLGRVELEITKGARPVLITAGDATRLIKIDDTIVGDDQAILDTLDGIIGALETATGAGSLVAMFSRVLDETITDDPTVLGDVYYRILGTTTFDVIGQRAFQETNILNLHTDAMLRLAESYGGPTMLAVQASGSVRGDIKKGETGALSFADLYRIFPLGQNPLDGSAGYPVCRFYLFTVEIRAAFELAASTGLVNDSFFLSPSGVHVEFDTSREPFDLADPFNTEKGRVTKITVDTDHSDGLDSEDEVLYDVTLPDPFSGPLGESLTLHPVVTSLYVASFAAAAGVTLKDEVGNEVLLTDTILERGDGTAIKEIDALLEYLARIGPALPSTYDENSPEGAIPRRMICSGPLCP